MGTARAVVPAAERAAAEPLAGLRIARRTRQATLALAALALLLLAAVVLGVGLGTVSLAPDQIVGILAHRLLGIDVVPTWSPAAEAIVVDLRLPRVLSAAVVGLGLSVAGATFQGLLRNPLADPYVLGTASGAALGAAIAILIPVRMVILEFGLIHGLAFVGALAAVTVVYRMSRPSGPAPMTSLLLTGYAIGSLLAAGLAMAMYLAGSNLRQIFFYLMGSLDGSTWARVAVAAPIILAGTALILVRARNLNGFLLGEETAAHLGVDVRRERAILLALASLVTAAAVTIAGLIGFVGLVVPHLVRLAVGPNARLVLPLSAIGGAALLIVADLVARMLGEIPVGVVTALLGAPFFLSLLRRARSGYEL
jgi:iron complex transport system permease protein